LRGKYADEDTENTYLLTDTLQLAPPPQVKQKNDKTLLVIEGTHVQQSNHASGTKPIKRSVRYLRRLILARKEASFERKLALEAQIVDLDWQKVKQYVAGRVASLGTGLVAEALIKRGCLAKDEEGHLYPTNAGVLLFGCTPERFFPSAGIIAVHYDGLQMSDTYTRQDIRGSLPDQLQQAEVFVQNHMSPTFYLKDLDWQERPVLPLDAVREVIANAVAHRAYDKRGDSIRLFIFADRLECYSPGCLPGHITVDNLLTERLSRNETIVQVLSDMGFTERLGYGLNRLARRMAEEGLPPPKFEETAAGFKVILFNRPATHLACQPDANPVYKWMAQGLYERQIKAMNFALEHGRVNSSDYARLCPDVSSETLCRDLVNLVERDLLLKVGDNRVTYYILK
jgi:ATP-dependent DNA helicase RecG